LSDAQADCLNNNHTRLSIRRRTPAAERTLLSTYNAQFTESCSVSVLCRARKGQAETPTVNLKTDLYIIPDAATSKVTDTEFGMELSNSFRHPA